MNYGIVLQKNVSIVIGMGANILSYWDNLKERNILYSGRDLFDKLLSGIYCILYIFFSYIFPTILKLMDWRHYDYGLEFMKVGRITLFWDLSNVYYRNIYSNWRYKYKAGTVYIYTEKGTDPNQYRIMRDNKGIDLDKSLNWTLCKLLQN